MEYKRNEAILNLFIRLNRTRLPIAGLTITEDGQHILLELLDGSKFIISETDESV